MPVNIADNEQLLEHHTKTLEAIDAQIMELLRQRFSTVRQQIAIRRVLKRPARDFVEQQNILERAAQHGPGMERAVKAIHDVCIQLFI